MAYVRVDNAVKYFPREDGSDMLVLDRVSFDTKEFGITCLLGPSGCGKSTLLNVISGLERLDDGKVEVVSDGSRSRQQARLGYVFQDPRLLNWKSVEQNLAFALKGMRVPTPQWPERLNKYLEIVGLDEFRHQFPLYLSGGMRQRVGLARALATEADLLFMDEPFSALDPLIRHDLQGQLLELQRKLHKTIVFVTHDFQEALRIGNRVAVMRQGSLVQVGRPSELVMSPADDYVTAFSRQVDPTQFVRVADLPLPTACSAANGLPSVGSGALLQDIYPLLAQHDRLAVTDDAGTCVGELSRQEVFDHLGRARADQNRAVGAGA
jgi:glycine betaine/proline transport system ATP-binding protein